MPKGRITNRDIKTPDQLRDYNHQYYLENRERIMEYNKNMRRIAGMGPKWQKINSETVACILNDLNKNNLSKFKVSCKYEINNYSLTKLIDNWEQRTDSAEIKLLLEAF